MVEVYRKMECNGSMNKNIQNVVEKALINYEDCKDSDNFLVARIWYDTLQEPLRSQCLPLLKLIAKGKLPSFESVSRCRRKLQEIHPDLRGSKYEKRHLRAEEVKQSLVEMDADHRGINYEVNTPL